MYAVTRWWSGSAYAAWHLMRQDESGFIWLSVHVHGGHFFFSWFAFFAFLLYNYNLVFLLFNFGSLGKVRHLTWHRVITLQTSRHYSHHHSGPRMGCISFILKFVSNSSIMVLERTVVRMCLQSSAKTLQV